MASQTTSRFNGAGCQPCHVRYDGHAKSALMVRGAAAQHLFRNTPSVACTSFPVTAYAVYKGTVEKAQSPSKETKNRCVNNHILQPLSEVRFRGLSSGNGNQLHIFAAGGYHFSMVSAGRRSPYKQATGKRKFSIAKLYWSFPEYRLSFTIPPYKR